MALMAPMALMASMALVASMALMASVALVAPMALMASVALVAPIALMAPTVPMALMAKSCTFHDPISGVSGIFRNPGSSLTLGIPIAHNYGQKKC